MGTPLSAADRAEIAQLASRYSWAIDSRDADHFAALFTPDGAFHDPNGEHRGAAALRQVVEAMAVADMAVGLQHWTANAMYVGDGKSCRGRSMMLGVQHVGGNSHVAFIGMYRDEYIKADGEWRFASRTWLPWSVERAAKELDEFTVESAAFVAARD
jgi:SnoaL-like domain